MGKCSIYYLVCPIDGKVRYVGKSTNPKSRYKDHCEDIGTATAKKMWLKKLQDKNLKPILNIIQDAEDLLTGRELEHLHVMRNIKTIYNIFQPRKNTCTIHDYRKLNNIIPDVEFFIKSKYDKLK